MTGLCPPPGPTARFPGQLLLAFRRDPLGLLQRMARDYGDVSLVRLGNRRVHLLNHPDLIKDLLVTEQRRFHKGRGLELAKHLLGEGLLTSEDEFHRRQRRLMQPAFHSQRIASYASAMVQHAERTSERWSRLVAQTPTPPVVDIHQEMMRLTLGIVGKTLFNTEVEDQAREIGQAIATSMELFRSFTTLPFAPLLERLPLPSTWRFLKARERLDATIYGLIKDRRSTGEDRGDLLSMLLMAQDDEGSGGMSDRQVRDEAMTLFLAGHETTSNALTWTWYLLSQHPAVETRLHAEIDQVLGGRSAVAEDMHRLVYTWQVLAESMRLYPPAWVIGRRAIEDYEVAGYRIPRDSIVLASQWVTQRDARFFPEPDRFDPDRWTEVARAARPRFAYFPFGGGARVCIGEQFAWLEGVLVLATLARRWRPRLAPGHAVALQPTITLRPRGGMKMDLYGVGNS
ncbi:MAG TPA: cytochrome P450 [Gemmatimonadales bacterium]|nr:cytochrome P450 [Gemmatimonadales bacterium]